MSGITLEEFINSKSFPLKNGDKIQLEEFTLHAELWAKAEFGSIEEFYLQLFGEGDYENPVMPTILKALLYLMDSSDKERILRGAESGEAPFTTLSKQMNYKNFSVACQVLFEIIKDALPLEELKKNLMAQEVPKVTKKTTKKSKAKKAMRKKKK